VLVSEVMLQQTPVVRVVPSYEAWIARWPSARALAAAPSGEAVRQWGRLGYPRRALRLHAACTEVVERYDGELPTTVGELLSLPLFAALCAGTGMSLTLENAGLFWLLSYAAYLGFNYWAMRRD
jgi:A/G-specific adenine glycosylase